MADFVDRSFKARLKRKPHLFLSHCSKDKPVVVKLAADLNILGVDAWLDDWELQVGDDIYDTISNALAKSEYVAVIISNNFLESRWANDEMKQALAREHREKRNLVLPLIIGDAEVPPFIESRLYLDFRQDFYGALTKLAGMIHQVSKVRIERAIASVKPKQLVDVIKALEYAGHDDVMLLDSQDYEEIIKLGGWIEDGYVWFYPCQIEDNPKASPQLRSLMTLIKLDA